MVILFIRETYYYSIQDTIVGRGFFFPFSERQKALVDWMCYCCCTWSNFLLKTPIQRYTKQRGGKSKGIKLFLSSWNWIILSAFLLQIYNLTSCSLPRWQDQTWNEMVKDIVSSCLSGHNLTAMMGNTHLGISKPGICYKRKNIKEEM